MPPAAISVMNEDRPSVPTRGLGGRSNPDCDTSESTGGSTGGRRSKKAHSTRGCVVYSEGRLPDDSPRDTRGCVSDSQGRASSTHARDARGSASGRKGTIRIAYACSTRGRVVSGNQGRARSTQARDARGSASGRKGTTTGRCPSCLSHGGRSCVNCIEDRPKCNAPRAATGGSPSCVDHGGSRTVRERRPASEPTHTGSRLGGAASRLGQPHHGVRRTNISPHCGL